MTSETMHEVKSASAILADDVICQSFIQSSSTLAYACLLIRRKRYDLAVHVLHSLEAKQASRFKDMVFYLQAQIGIETGEFATAKKRLVPRVHQHPNDMVALSLLECCIYHEWIAWAKTLPADEFPEPAASALSAAASAGFPVATLDTPPPVSASVFGNAQAAEAAAQAAAYSEPASFRPVNHFANPSAPESPAAGAMPLSGLLEIQPKPPAAKEVPTQAQAFGVRAAPAKPAAGFGPSPTGASPTGASPAASGVSRLAASGGDGDLGIYQSLANDQNTQSMVIWNAERGKLKTSSRNPELEALAAMLPQELPVSMQGACSLLEAGTIHKICFSFQNLTVTSFHSGAENMSLMTGHISQSLLTIVRAENAFRKQAFSLAQASVPSQSARSAEYAANE